MNRTFHFHHIFNPGRNFSDRIGMNFLLRDVCSEHSHFIWLYTMGLFFLLGAIHKDDRAVSRGE